MPHVALGRRPHEISRYVDDGNRLSEQCGHLDGVARRHVVVTLMREQNDSDIARFETVFREVSREHHDGMLYKEFAHSPCPSSRLRPG
jgi:hypothetical protein